METAPRRLKTALCFSLWQWANNLKLQFIEYLLCARYSLCAYCVPKVESGDLSVFYPFLTMAQPGSWLHRCGSWGFLAQGHTIGVHLIDKLLIDCLAGFVVGGVLSFYNKPSYLETKFPNLSRTDSWDIVCPMTADTLLVWGCCLVNPGCGSQSSVDLRKEHHISYGLEGKSQVALCRWQEQSIWSTSGLGCFSRWLHSVFRNVYSSVYPSALPPCESHP